MLENGLLLLLLLLPIVFLVVSLFIFLRSKRARALSWRILIRLFVFFRRFFDNKTRFFPVASILSGSKLTLLRVNNIADPSLKISDSFLFFILEMKRMTFFLEEMTFCLLFRRAAPESITSYIIAACLHVSYALK